MKCTSISKSTLAPIECLYSGATAVRARGVLVQRVHVAVRAQRRAARRPRRPRRRRRARRRRRRARPALAARASRALRRLQHAHRPRLAAPAPRRCRSRLPLPRAPGEHSVSLCYRTMFTLYVFRLSKVEIGFRSGFRTRKTRSLSLVADSFLLYWPVYLIAHFSSSERLLDSEYYHYYRVLKVAYTRTLSMK